MKVGNTRPKTKCHISEKPASSKKKKATYLCNAVSKNAWLLVTSNTRHFPHTQHNCSVVIKGFKNAELTAWVTQGPMKCTHNLNELKGWGRRDCTVVGSIKYFDNLVLNVARRSRSVELKGLGRKRLLPHHSSVQLFASWNCGKSRTYSGGYLVFRSKLKLGTSRAKSGDFEFEPKFWVRLWRH